MNGSADLGNWWQALRAASADDAEAIHTAYQRLENAGLISKVTVHRYLCGRCGPLATVIRLGDTTIARTVDYKYSRGLNLRRSAAAARERNTLDGERHWPGHTYDVDALADWGPQAGFDVVCRHVTTTVAAVDVLALTRDVKPGHPGKPTRL